MADAIRATLLRYVVRLGAASKSVESLINDLPFADYLSTTIPNHLIENLDRRHIGFPRLEPHPPGGATPLPAPDASSQP